MFVRCPNAVSSCSCYCTFSRVLLFQMNHGSCMADVSCLSLTRYSISKPDEYQKVTGYVKAAKLIGKLLAAIIGQSVVAKFGHAAYLPLNYVSTATVFCSCLVALMLIPESKVQTEQGRSGLRIANDTAYERVADGYDQEKQENIKRHSGPKPESKSRTSMLTKDGWRAFCGFYSNLVNVQWCLWSALGLCGLYQVENYIGNLWDEVSHGKSEWNAGADIAATVLGVLAAGLPSVIPNTQHIVNKYGEIILGILSGLCGGLLFVLSAATASWIAYGGYVIFRAIYTLAATIVTAQVAVCLSHTFPATGSSSQRFGMVWGFNALFAMGIESILQFIVGKHGLNVIVRGQYVIYGIYFLLLAILFVLVACVKSVWRSSTVPSESLPQSPSYIALSPK